jgi:hypothetical protein
MFNLEDARHFYKVGVPRDYRKAWYLFVYKFLICVNGDLLKSIQGSQAKEQKNIFNFVTVSDEAFARWVLEIKYIQVIKNLNNPVVVKKGFQKPSGPHASLQFSSRYSEIYKEVLDGRIKTRNDWNDIFWAYFKANHPLLFKENCTITHENMARATQNSFPELDDDQVVQPVTKTNQTSSLLDEDEMEDATVDV